MNEEPKTIRDLVEKYNYQIQRMTPINEEYDNCEETLKAKANRKMIIEQKEAFLKLLDELGLNRQKSKIEAAYRALSCGRDEKEATKQFFAETKDVRYKIADIMRWEFKKSQDVISSLKEEVRIAVDKKLPYTMKEAVKEEWFVNFVMEVLFG